MEIQKTLKSQSNLKKNGDRGINLTSDYSTKLQSSRRYERKKRVSCSVMPNSLQSHGLQPPRLLLPWDFTGKDTGLGCHLLLQRAYRDPQIACSWLGFPQDKRIKMISASFLAHTPSLNLLSMCAVLSCF